MASSSTSVVLGAKDNVSPTLRKVGAELSLFRRNMDGFSASLRGALSVGAGVGFAASLVQIGQASLDAQIELERLGKSYQSIFGEAAAGSQLEYILKTSNELGLSFTQTAEAAKGFFASGQGTTLAPEMNRIFEAFSTAGSAMQLSGEQMDRIFLALGQSVAKGRILSEELRGQIGEALPGAFQLAAKAMGMTTAELDKFMADGKLTAEDLLPKLATVLEETYARGAENAANSVQASINRMDTAWTLFKSNILKSEPVVTIINRITKALDAQNALRAQMDARQKAIDALKAEGVKPEGVSGEYLDESIGTMVKVHYADQYSERQIKDQQAYLEILQRQTGVVEELAKKEAALAEKRTGDMRQAIDSALKNTYDYQLRELENERADTLQKIRAGIDAAVREGSSEAVIAQLEADFEAVKKVYEQKLADLKKKHAPKDTSGGSSSGRGSARRTATDTGSPLSADWGGAAADLQATRDAFRDVEKSEADLREELDRDPFRAMLHYSREWADSTKHMGLEVADVLTGAFDSAADSLANFVVTGKFNFADFTNSILTDLARIAARQAIGGIVGGLVGSIGSFFGGGGGGLDSISGGTSFWAQGGVLSGGNISAFSGSVVSSPTLFSYDRALPRFASGAGLMGEAGPEAIMPLARMANGRLGVAAGGAGAGPVNVTIINQTGTQAEAQVEQRQNPQGGMDMSIILMQVDQGMAGLARSGKSHFVGMLEKNYGLNRAGVLTRNRR